MKELPSKQSITVKKIHYRGVDRLGLYFSYNDELIQKIKQLPHRRYSHSMKCWHLPYTKASMAALAESGIEYTIALSAPIDTENPSDNTAVKSESLRPPKKKTSTIPELKRRSKVQGTISAIWASRLAEYQQYLEQKRYSSTSIKSYMNVLNIFFVWFGDRAVSELDLARLRKFNHVYFFKNQYSRSYQNVWINAMKLFIDKFGDIPVDIHALERPRKTNYLPNILSEDEAKRLIRSYANLKHRAIIMTVYACGLRKSELVHLKLTDIDSQRMVIRIRNSKGAKDRDVSLPESLLGLLRSYAKVYKPKQYLFNGQKKPMYSTRSIDQLLIKGLKRAHIKKKITLHSLRHSYATHLVEKNINLTRIMY